MQSTVVITVVTPNHTSTIEVEGPSHETLDRVLAQILPQTLPQATSTAYQDNENTLNTNSTITGTKSTAQIENAPINRATTNSAATEVRVDGRPIDARAITLHDLTRASVVECITRPNAPYAPSAGANSFAGLHRYRSPRAGRRSSTRSPSELWVVSGPDSGRRFPIAPGTQMIGRSPRVPLRIFDATVSSQHLAITVGSEGTVCAQDNTSANGTLLDTRNLTESTSVGTGNLLTLGTTKVAVTEASKTLAATVPGPMTQSGTRPFNRPPRSAPASNREAITVPAAGPEVRAGVRFSVAAMIAPVAMGLVMALLVSPRMAMFALMSPVMFLANFAEDKRRVKREKKTGQVDMARQLENFSTTVRLRMADATAQLHASNYDLAHLTMMATHGDQRLWERRAHHDDAFQVRLGLGDRRVQFPLRETGARLSAVDEVLNNETVVIDAPVTVDLRPGAVLGIVGTHTDRLQAARALIAQMVSLHGPADLTVATIAKTPLSNTPCLSESLSKEWDWMRWLPHTQSIETDTGVLLGDETLAEVLVRIGESAAKANELHDMSSGSNKSGSQTRRTVAPRCLLVVIDDATATNSKNSPLRALLSRHLSGVSVIVLADRVEQLPDCSTAVLQLPSAHRTSCEASPRFLDHVNTAEFEINPSSTLPYAVLETMADGQRQPLVVDGISLDVVEDLARSLAQWDDTAANQGDRELPARITLSAVLAPNVVLDETTLIASWAAANRNQRALVATIGMCADEPTAIDLVGDGPHALIAGTTGSGKSELLRTLVASLAASYPPDLCNFVLIDYKGASAFAECALLPHTVGMVTDLDPGTAKRALVCLEAELKRRERLLLSAGAEDLIAYAARPTSAPLPRLVVVIDEFATLAKDLPDFVTALIDVAQRGRSLGVHLILATQRPTGAVNDNIRANTNLRIALRVHDAGDSTDVLGVSSAASIGRRTPGRALLRTGPGEVTAFQTANSSALSGARQETLRIRILPDIFGPSSDQMRSSDTANKGNLVNEANQPASLTNRPSLQAKTAQTELEVLVANAQATARARAIPEQLRPWPELLPSPLSIDSINHPLANGFTGAAIALGGHASSSNNNNNNNTFAIGVADLPEEQRLACAHLDLDAGNIAFIGMSGTGVSTALLTVAAQLATTQSPEQLHMYALDHAGHTLGALEVLPHVGAVIAGSDEVRRVRLIRFLATELEQRRSLSGHDYHDAPPRIVVFIDNYPSLRSAHDDMVGIAHLDSLHRTIVDGPAHGITFVITADRPTALPSIVSSAIATRLAFRLADPFDYAHYGIRPTDAGSLSGNRALEPSTGREVEVAMCEPASLSTIANSSAHVAFERGPQPIRVLPVEVRMHDLGEAPRPLHAQLWLPFALADDTLSTTGFALADSECALITGPARSGKSTTLSNIAKAAIAQNAHVQGIVVAPRRTQGNNELTWTGPAELKGRVTFAESLAQAVEIIRAHSDQPHLLLIDDAEMVDDPGNILSSLLAERHNNVWVIAAGRADVLRTSYTHWTTAIRRSRIGLALRPQLEIDGELWMTPLPRRVIGQFPTGRGFLITDGTTTLIQSAA
jgi:DNA segregation ATPase FtsK/SpoIIIE, S-DNA-T family